MIIIPILLTLFTGLLILRLCNLHKQINIFEQIALGFVSALSLCIFEIFLQGIIFDKLSLLLPISTFIICLGIFVYKCLKVKGLGTEIISSIKGNFLDIKDQFKSQKTRQKILVCVFCIYALAKCFMVFSINLHMPTYDEDAVTGWDLKTKVYTENKALVLDKDSPEYLGSAYDRNIFAPLTDAYFLLADNGINIANTNILSPIIYLLSIIILFGILLRKGNLIFASLSSYIFTSLPFLFIHGFGSYFNFPSGVLLFIFFFYLIDQLLENNKNIIIPLILLGFLTTTIRNESYIFMIAIIACLMIYLYCTKKHNEKNIKGVIINILWILIGLIIGIFCLKYSEHILPQGTVMNFGGTDLTTSSLSVFLDNLFGKGLIKAVIQQGFFHPDYNIIYTVFLIVLFFSFIVKIQYKKIIFHFIPLIVLLFSSSAILIYNPEGLGLITHYSFVRYGIIYMPFLIFLIVYILYKIYEKKSGE